VTFRSRLKVEFRKDDTAQFKVRLLVLSKWGQVTAVLIVIAPRP
jgi:hypothetical protein